MTQLNIKSQIDNVQMNILLRLLHSWNLETEVVQEDMLQSEALPSPSKYHALHQARGMWADYDIDVKRNRAQTRARRTQRMFAL